jgi:hypothetical protein
VISFGMPRICGQFAEDSIRGMLDLEYPPTGGGDLARNCSDIKYASRTNMRPRSGMIFCRNNQTRFDGARISLPNINRLTDKVRWEVP